ncbi:hypothetical protein GCK72_002110 [Caenorhabditis remanei]|uniref:Uncharacterized protein n=1 Tax=Caenorhabditis remanei TaxID=31234 RepID=A0A6A5HWQ8_CAERE|nr:hypothetical protein GCK72_002110 [Caenorhabditis remanei]KAF1770292.1 hypothetical protein GCK72_002110 [Caenorhabditis remanei]
MEAILFSIFSETVQIYSNEYALDDDHVSYEIASSPSSNSYDQVSDSIRIMVNNQSSCPAACTITLNRYTDSFQGAESTVLFFDTDHSFYLPSHYIKDNKTTLVCVANNGSCGATVPIYRYYKISNGGVFHAYSIDQDVVYDGYNQEFLPICYAWTVPTATVASRPTCGTLTFDIPPEMMSDLNIYDNKQDGIERDHYYTTLHSTDSSLVSYNLTGVLGKVLTSSKSTACSCLVKLQQQFDNQTGYFHRLDHKLIVTGQESNRPYEEYVDTGETIYCSKRLGDCGATLPLWKHFQFYDVDTVYTTDSSPLPMSYLYPQTPLCYIWPANYSPNASNIVYGTAAPAPPVPLTTSLPGISESTITPTTPTGTTGSTRFLDSSGSTSLSTIIPMGQTSQSTLNTSPTASTPTTPVSMLISSSGTTVSSSLLNSSTETTLSTSSVFTINTIPTMQTSGIQPTVTASSMSTATTSQSTNPSTLSVWGTTGSTASVPTVTTSDTTGTTGMTTPSTPMTTPTSGTPMTTGTTRLSDSGGVTPGLIIPMNPSITLPTTPDYPMTPGEEVTEVNVDTEPPLEEEFTRPTPETFTLSNFWFLTTTTQSTIVSSGTPATNPASPAATLPVGTVPSIMSTVPILPVTATSLPSSPATLPTASPLFPASPVTANNVPNPTGTIPPIGSKSVDTTSSTPALPITTTPPPPVMVTGPLVLIIPTMPPQSSEAPTTALPTTLPTAPSSTLATTTPTPPSQVSTIGTTHSLDGSPATPTPQHMAQAAPTYSIVGGALDSFTNPPIIAALISSSVASTPSPTQSQPTQPVLNLIPSTATIVSTTQDPGIIWKAGDWISNTWHSVFGGNDQVVVSTSSASPTEDVTTPRPIGGLVGSLINSSGGNATNSTNPVSSFLNSTGNFIDQHLNSNSSQAFVNNTINWIDDKLDSTGELLSNAWNSLQSNNNTSGSFVNNTQTWIGGALNSTGGFLSNAWDSLSGNNNSTGIISNNTQSWISGAVNSTGNFISNSWDSLSSNNNTQVFVNNTQTWIGGALNSTGGFLTNAWNSLSFDNQTSGNVVNTTKTWIGGAVDNTGEFLSNAWESLSDNSILDKTKTGIGGAVNSTGSFLSNAWNEIKGGSGNSLNTSQVNETLNGASQVTQNVTSSADEKKDDLTVKNDTALASAPHSNPVGSVASVILPIVNNSTSDPANGKVEWNGGLVSGPITG